MDSPSASEYENVKTPEALSKSTVNQKLKDLLNVNTELEMRLFCPLCVCSFSYKFSLFEHLRTFHFNFLSQAGNQNICFKECPFCNSKFHGKNLMAKHVLRYHSKVVQVLFVNSDRLKCLCNIKKTDHKSMGKHIEKSHFLDFEEEFSNLFSCDTTQDISVSSLINSTYKDENSEVENWEDVCVTLKENLRNLSHIKDFKEASRINCYDFTELKQQLENIKYSHRKSSSKKPHNKSSFGKSNLKSSARKPILKDTGNIRSPHKSARRVLRFDLPEEEKEICKSKPIRLTSDDENKENFYITSTNKLCDDDKCDSNAETLATFFDKPQHSSTPNVKTIISENEKKCKHLKSSFKSYITKSETSHFEFQCGKCRSLFQKNSDLVSHIKNYHKKFSLNSFKPRYNCAICNARFFRNCYLKKHHNIHLPY